MGVVVVDRVVEDLETVDLMAKGAAAMAVAVSVGKSSYTCKHVLLQEGGVVPKEVAMVWVETAVAVLGVEAMAVVDSVVVVVEAMAERVTTPTAARAPTVCSHRLRRSSTRRRPGSAFDAYSPRKAYSSTPCTVRLQWAY